MASKEFSLGAVLSVTTGVLLCSMDEVCRILDFMTGGSLFTHQLPRAADVCKPAILKQHPQLADVDTAGVGNGNWLAFLAEQEEKFGKSLLIEPLAVGEYTHKDPITEMVEMTGGKKPTVVVTGPVKNPRDVVKGDF